MSRKSYFWRVTLNDKEIDIVNHNTTDADEVWRSLVNHDGYDPGIEVERVGPWMDVADVLAYRGNTHNSDGELTVNAYQHQNALRRSYTSPFGRAIRHLIEGWARMAIEHRRRYESLIGDDGYTGEHWANIGRALRGLLSCELGGWDAGSLDSNILEFAEEHGVNLED